MKTKITFIHLILIAIILGSAHIFMLKSGFYGQRNWIDIPLHIVAGIYLGLVFLWWKNRKESIKNYKSLILGLMVFGLAGGILWEVFEYALWNLFPKAGNYVAISKSPISNSIQDLTLDTFSGLVWLLFIRPKKYNKNIQN